MTTIYLLDCHAIVRDGLRAILESEGYTVVGEGSAPTTALADIARTRPDLLLLEVLLENRSGLELLALIRQRRLRVRSIVLTMSSQRHHIVEALRHGAFGYLSKHASRDELMRAVEAVSLGNRFLATDTAEFAVQVLTSADDAESLAKLSPREQQIIRMIAEGRSNSTIGRELHLSPKTVATYRSRLMTKLGAGNVTGLVRFAIRNGLIAADLV